MAVQPGTNLNNAFMRVASTKISRYSEGSIYTGRHPYEHNTYTVYVDSGSESSTKGCISKESTEQAPCRT